MTKAWPKWCFSFVSATCHGFYNYNFRIGWRTQTKIFPRMKFTIVPAFYNKPDYLQNLADSIKGHLGIWLRSSLFSYHGIPERHIRKQISQNHIVKLTDLVATRLTSSRILLPSPVLWNN
jgi:protoheme ferro-lyase